MCELEGVAPAVVDVVGSLPSPEQDERSAETEPEHCRAEQEQPGEAHRSHQDVCDADFLRGLGHHLDDDRYDGLSRLNEEHGPIVARPIGRYRAGYTAALFSDR